MKIGFLKKDSQERFNLKRGWVVNAWRVVDAQGVDMFQPWCNSKADAIETARQIGIHVPKVGFEVRGGVTVVSLMPEFRISSESGLFYDLKVEMQRQGYDCIKTAPQRDGHMTSAPFYIRARDKSWCILDDQHEVRDAAEYINKNKQIILRNYWGTPAPKKGNNDQLSGVLQAAVGQQQGGADPGLHVPQADLS